MIWSLNNFSCQNSMKRLPYHGPRKEIIKIEVEETFHPVYAKIFSQIAKRQRKGNDLFLNRYLPTFEINFEHDCRRFNLFFETPCLPKHALTVFS